MSEPILFSLGVAIAVLGAWILSIVIYAALQGSDHE